MILRITGLRSDRERYTITLKILRLLKDVFVLWIDVECQTYASVHGGGLQK